jgi:hypothetical protein
MKRKKTDDEWSEEPRDPQIREAKVRRTNPARSKRLAENKYLDLTTIKCTIGPFCRYKVVRDEINQTVYWMSKLNYHSHHVMTLHLLESKGYLPTTKNLYGHWNSLMRTLANHLSNKKTTGLFAKACEEYTEQTGLQRNWPKDVTSGWRGKVLDQLAMSAQTTHSNHMNVNYPIYLKRYINFLCQTYTEIKTLEERDYGKFQKVFGLIVSSLDVHRNKTVEEIINLRPKTKEVVPLDHSVWTPVKGLVGYLRGGYGSESILDCKDPLVKMPLLYKILKPLEKHGQTLQQQWRDSTIRGKKKKQKWAFPISPQATFRPQHVRISSTAIKMLFLGLTKDHSHLKTLYEACCRESQGLSEWEANNKFWNALFDLRKVSRRTKGRFGNSIETDGVGVSCSFQQRKSEVHCDLIDLRARDRALKQQIKDMGNSPCTDTVARREEVKRQIKEKEKIVEASMSCTIEKAIEMTNSGELTVQWDEDTKVYRCNKKVVACDPGMRNTTDFVTHSPDAMMHHNNWKVSDGGYHTTKEQRFASGCIYGNWWRHISGQKKYTNKMTKRLHDFCPEMLHVPTTKTSSKETLLESYRYQVTLLPDLEEAYFSDDRWFQKMKMRKYVKTQQALERVVRAITGEKNKVKQKEVVVAYGDQSMAGCMRGLAPLLGNALVRKLRKDTTFFFVDEFQTSSKCSCCHAEMSSSTSFRVKRCINNDCIRTHWDRDINAAINILLNFFYHVVHKKRHGDFSRQVNPTSIESTS